jgi:hypothetical protein
MGVLHLVSLNKIALAPNERMKLLDVRQNNYIKYTVNQKGTDPSRDVNNQLYLAGNNQINPLQGEFGDIPAGNGKIANLHLQCMGQLFLCFVHRKRSLIQPKVQHCKMFLTTVKER